MDNPVNCKDKRGYQDEYEKAGQPRIMSLLELFYDLLMNVGELKMELFYELS